MIFCRLCRREHNVTTPEFCGHFAGLASDIPHEWVVPLAEYETRVAEVSKLTGEIADLKEPSAHWKTSKVDFKIKAPDALYKVIRELGLPEEYHAKYFEFREYATLEIEIKEDMTFTGRVVPL